MLLAAYDDAAGVTAAFNKNVLTRINRELGGHFDLDRFRHVARWNDAASRVEMHLESVGRAGGRRRPPRPSRAFRRGRDDPHRVEHQVRPPAGRAPPHRRRLSARGDATTTPSGGSRFTSRGRASPVSRGRATRSSARPSDVDRAAQVPKARLALDAGRGGVVRSPHHERKRDPRRPVRALRARHRTRCRERCTARPPAARTASRSAVNGCTCESA